MQDHDVERSFTVQERLGVQHVKVITRVLRFLSAGTRNPVVPQKRMCGY